MADGLLNAFLNILLGKAGREELVRVNEARRAQDLEDREKKIKMMQEASDEVTANMSPARKKIVESVMSVQHNSEQRVFEGMSEEQKEAMREDALDQVFGQGGGLKGD